MRTRVDKKTLRFLFCFVFVRKTFVTVASEFEKKERFKLRI